MTHIIRIREGRFFTKILLRDDNNKKSSIKYKSAGFRKIRNEMGITRRMDKTRRLVNMYNFASDENDQVSTYDIKEEAYYRISTVATLAIEKAMDEGKLEKDTVKEVLDGFFKEKEIREEKNKRNMENIKIEVNQTEDIKRVEENMKDESIDTNAEERNENEGQLEK